MFEELKPLVKEGNLVVLTGAGVSAESGIQTFRDAGGLWENHSLEEVATPQGYKKNPDLVLRFYNERRRGIQDKQPNAGHFALAELEKKLGDRFFLVTQNIDDLHEKAGSQRLVHMHGELKKVRCTRDFAHVMFYEGDLSTTMRCKDLGADKTCEGALRPHVVWFHELPFEMDRIYKKIEQCRYFISLGTSGVVYPASQFVDLARVFKALTVEINLDKTPGQFDYAYQGKSGILLPQLVQALWGV
jgi:NAD-dependent deacetylase